MSSSTSLRQLSSPASADVHQSIEAREGLQSSAAIDGSPTLSLQPALADFILLESADHATSWSSDGCAQKPVEDEGIEFRSSTKVDTTSACTLGDDHQPPRPDAQDELIKAVPRQMRPNSIAGSFASRSPREEKKDSRIELALPEMEQQSGATEQGQAIYLPEEDVQLHLSFLRRSIFRMVVWYAICIMTAGVWFVIDVWSNHKYWVRWNCGPVSFRDLCRSKGFLVMVKSKHGEVDILPLKRIGFVKPVEISEVFPSSLPVPFKSASDAATREVSLDAHEAGSDKADSASNTQLDYVDVLEYRATTFLLHPPTGKFRLLSSWRDPSWTRTQAASKGITAPTVVERKALFGPNQVSVPGKSVLDIMLDEVLHPFYIFQIYSIVLWCNDDYVPYAIVIACISLVGIAATTVTTKRAINRLKKMSQFTCEVEAFRTASSNPSAGDEKAQGAEGSWMRLSSEELLPGDLVDICATRDGTEGGILLSVLPCDLVLLEGDCIVNESMLTGESVPVVKSPISNSEMATVLAAGGDLSRIDKHLVYSGTRIVRARPPSSERRAKSAVDGSDAGETKRARALVVRTGFSTAKGSLVRQMLFPRPINFKFYRDGFWFIGYLLIIALMGMIATSIYFKHIGVDAEEIALRSLDVLTIACPPALPATLSICITFAIARLRRAQIFCISPQRINVAGKINMLVFDKTGTLTEEGLDVLGVRAVESGERFGNLLLSSRDLSTFQHGQSQPLQLDEALATAHDLNLMDGKALGEPLEVKMLEWTGRELEDDAERAPVVLRRTGQGPDDTAEPQRPRNADGQLCRVPVVLPSEDPVQRKLAVIRQFAFSSELRRMSVIVARHAEVGAQIYTKGAPEAIVSLCRLESIPADYDKVLDQYTRQGFRVLAVAGKVIEATSWAAAQNIPRSAAESSLTFLGLVVFENKLKAGTAPAIATLQGDACLPIKVCTGDSVLTAVSVAKECGILETAASVYAPRLVRSTEVAQIEWVNLDDDRERLDPYSLDPTNGQKLRDVELAISGEVLRALVDACCKETIERMLVRAKVFARMSPEQKQDLVERLQNLGFTVAFTGDGANDCGALKAADVGLSLSEAEASVAAPFTSRQEDISCVARLIREGRSTLTVSFSMFKWMACYSLCQYMTVLLLYGQATSLDNAEYLFVDVFTVLPIAIGMANSLPAKKLHRKPPASRLASFRPIVSTFGQVVLIFVAQTVVYVVLHQKSWYEPPELDPNDLELNNMDNTVLFRTSAFGYLIAAICYSAGPPHRQPLYLNWILLPAIVILNVFALYFLFLRSGPFHELFGFVQPHPSFSWIIFAVVVVQLVLAILFEAFGVDLAVRYVSHPFKRLAKRMGRYREKHYVRITRAIQSGK